jgi:hypothetical protein
MTLSSLDLVWRCGSAWLDAFSSEFALGSATHRPADFAGRCLAAEQRFGRGILPPGAAGDRRRSPGRVEVGMTAHIIVGIWGSTLEDV